MRFAAPTLHYLRTYKSQAIINVIANILATFFTIISFVVLKPFLDILFSQPTSLPIPTAAAASTGWLSGILDFFTNILSTQIQENGRYAGLVMVCGIILAMFFFKNLFRYWALHVMSPVRNGIERDLRRQLFSKLQALPLSFFSDERKGDLLARFSTDVQEIQWSVLRSLETFVRAPISVLGSLFVMLYVSPQLTIFSFALMLVVGGLIGQIGKTLKKTSADAQNTLGSLLTVVEETLGGMRIVRAFGAEHYQLGQFDKLNQSYFKLQTRIQRRRELSSPLTEFLGIGIIAALLLFGGMLVFEGHFEASTFVVFVMMFYNIIEPAKSFASAFYDIQKGRAAAERVGAILNVEIPEPNKPNALSIGKFEHDIVFKDVTFGYLPNHTVLHGINLRIPFGKTVAIVGASGSGKSTMIDLLPRFYEVQDGAIYLGETDLRDFRREDVRRLYGIVSQEPILFNDTIYNNIVFGLENVKPEQVHEAARLANAHDFIMATENGYDSPIGDRGAKLSGGQRQRLTLARAILRNPPVLILDEATSALDAESERLIQEALANLRVNRTVIIIAHRFSTIQAADEIVVIEHGRIVEQGTHAQLVENQAVYAKLHQLQQL